MTGPFDTPHTVPQPTPFQNVMGALGVTWGKNQSTASADAGRLEEDRQRKQQAAVWGPLYKMAGELASQNPEWGTSKVMLSIVQSPEYMQATSTPGFDHPNAGKNILELVKSTRPAVPNLHNIPQGNLTIAQQPQGAANAGAINPIATGGTETQEINAAGERGETHRTPGQVLDPTGGMAGAAAQPTGTPAPPAATTPAPPQFTYTTPDGGDSPEPVVPWRNSITEVPSELQGAADEAAFQNGIAPDAFASLLWKESRWKPNALGPVLKDGDRAYGIGQIKGSTWNEDIAPILGFAPTDINDPVKNMQGSAYYLGKLLRKYNGDYQTALMAYNWGQGNVARWDGDWSKVPDETVDFITDITNGNVNIPNIPKGPRATARRVIRAELPADRPASRDEVAALVSDNKQFMFLGSGGIPWLKDFITRTGRTIAPELAQDQEWAEVAQANRSNLAHLQWNLSKLNRAGDNRLRVFAEKALAMFPEGVMEDPYAANEAGINLYKNLSAQYYRNQEVTLKNSNSQAVKDTQNENLRIMDVLHSLPKLNQMLDMRTQMKSSDTPVQGPRGAVSDLAPMVSKGMGYAINTIKQLGDVAGGGRTDGAGSTNNPRSVTSTQAPTSTTGKPAINVVRDKDGNLVVSQ